MGDILDQSQIDALLSGLSGGEAKEPLKPLLENVISVLSGFFGETTSVSSITTESLPLSSLQERAGEHKLFLVRFTEEYRSLVFGFPPEDVFYYGEKMMGGDNESGEITDMHLSAFQEIVNQMGSKFSQELQPKGLALVPLPVEEVTETVTTKFPSVSDFTLLTVNYSFGSRESLLKLFLPTKFYEEVKEKFEEKEEEKAPSPETHGEESVLQFQPKDITPPVSEEEVRNIEILKDVPLEISVVLGKTKMKIKDVLKLGKGSVITLDRQVGERVDLLANNKLIAKGEVVVIGENFGFRITEILSPEDRLKELEI